MAHESFTRESHIEGSSNRSFGLVFMAAFLVIAAWPLMSGRPLRLWALALALVFGAAAWLAPQLLTGLNRLWMKLGLLLGRIVSPIALGLLYFTVFTPIGLLFRARGKDPLRIKKPADAASYWVARKPPGPEPETLNRQF